MAGQRVLTQGVKGDRFAILVPEDMDANPPFEYTRLPRKEQVFFA